MNLVQGNNVLESNAQVRESLKLLLDQVKQLS